MAGCVAGASGMWVGPPLGWSLSQEGKWLEGRGRIAEGFTHSYCRLSRVPKGFEKEQNGFVFELPLSL